MLLGMIDLYQIANDFFRSRLIKKCIQEVRWRNSKPAEDRRFNRHSLPMQPVNPCLHLLRVQVDVRDSNACERDLLLSTSDREFDCGFRHCQFKRSPRRPGQVISDSFSRSSIVLTMRFKEYSTYYIMRGCGPRMPWCVKECECEFACG